MNVISIVILAFSLLGAIDYLLGNKIGVGAEFVRAFSLFTPMALSMLGMIVIAPAIGVLLTPVFDGFYNIFGIDPSIIPASLFANDMGGMSLAKAICKSEAIGNYNAFVVSSMLGCVISFTIPFSLGLVKREQHKELFLGLLCGIATVPVGCFVSGLILAIPPLALIIDLIPLIIIALVIGTALVLVPKVCIKCFTVFGALMKLLGVIGLVLAIFTFLTKVVIHPSLDTLENASFVAVNACVTLSGALPLMFLVSKLLDKPLNKLGSKIGIDGTSAIAFLGSLVTNASSFGVMERMNKKGAILNSAFAVSASFVFGSHIAFTMVYDANYVLPVVLGKLISGFSAIALAMVVYSKSKASEEN